MIRNCRFDFQKALSATILMFVLSGLTHAMEASKDGEASAWRRYSNNEAGLSFQYPKNWVVEDEGFYETAGGSKAEEWSLILYREGTKDDSENWIRFNPRQFQETDGRCVKAYSNDICTYSGDVRVLKTLRKVAATTTVKRPAGPYTPTLTSKERAAILDALQKDVGGSLGEDILFNVEYLKVSRGWAWIHTLPQSYDGSNHYEDVSGLLHEEREGWSVQHLVPCCGECMDDPDCADDDRYFDKLRRRFPSAPPDIFPDATEKDTVQNNATVPALGSDAGTTATVNAPSDRFLALRSEPSTQRGRRLSKIPHGTRLTLGRCDVAAREHHWCRTTYRGQSGWVFDRYLLRDMIK